MNWQLRTEGCTRAASLIARWLYRKARSGLLADASDFYCANGIQGGTHPLVFLGSAP